MSEENIYAQKAREVSALLAVPDSRIIAGGTAVSREPGDKTVWVDISRLEGMDRIRLKGSRIEMGPLATLSAMGSSALLKTFAPALAESAASAAAPSIRERGTLGGNLASPAPGDTAPALLASGAKLTIQTETDYREILIDRFWHPDGENDLSFDEWIIRVTIQVPKEPFWGAAFGKTGEWDPRSSAASAAAVHVTLNEQNIITGIRGGMRLGGSAAQRMFPLEKALKNRPASAEELEAGARAMIPAASGVRDGEEFIGLLREILGRAVSMAAKRRTI